MLELPTDVYVQVWRRAAVLIDASPNVTWYRKALDPVGMQAMLPVYRDATVGKNRLRVLTVPLVVGSRPAGVMQLGTSLEVVEATQRTLLIVLLVGTLAAITAGWPGGLVQHAAGSGSAPGCHPGSHADHPRR